MSVMIRLVGNICSGKGILRCNSKEACWMENKILDLPEKMAGGWAYPRVVVIFPAEENRGAAGRSFQDGR